MREPIQNNTALQVQKPPKPLNRKQETEAKPGPSARPRPLLTACRHRPAVFGPDPACSRQLQGASVFSISLFSYRYSWKIEYACALPRNPISGFTPVFSHRVLPCDAAPLPGRFPVSPRSAACAPPAALRVGAFRKRTPSPAFPLGTSAAKSAKRLDVTTPTHAGARCPASHTAASALVSSCHPLWTRDLTVTDWTARTGKRTSKGPAGLDTWSPGPAPRRAGLEADRGGSRPQRVHPIWCPPPAAAGHCPWGVCPTCPSPGAPSHVKPALSGGRVAVEVSGATPCQAHLDPRSRFLWPVLAFGKVTERPWPWFPLL